MQQNASDVPVMSRGPEGRTNFVVLRHERLDEAWFHGNANHLRISRQEVSQAQTCTHTSQESPAQSTDWQNHMLASLPDRLAQALMKAHDLQL